MQRHFPYGFFILILMAVVILPGCGGGGTSAGPDNTVATVSVSPATLSMEFGQVTLLTPAALNAAGEAVLQTFTYSSNNTAVVNVSTNGNVCAGTWDTTFIVCTPALAPGTATITVTSSGITKTVPVSVHRRVASVSVTSTGVACTSQTMTQQFTAKAFASDGTDISSTVGAPIWNSSNAAVATLDTAGLATAKKSGSVTIAAVVNNVVSLPLTMVTCPPASITIKEVGSNPAVTAFTLNAAATKTLAPTIIDTLGNPITDITLAYSSSQLAVATVSTTGVITAAAPGWAGIVASCSPPTCNPGLNTPVYSNLVTVAVNGTSASTAYATGKNAVSIIPIDTTANTAGTAISIPTVTVNSVAVNPVINSMVFTSDGTGAYIGTDQGLFALNAVNNSVSQVASLVGKVLAVAPNTSRILISNLTAGVVYALNPNASPSPTTETLPILNATAAAFSPDGVKAYILSGNTVYVYSPVLPLHSYATGSAVTDAAVLTQGNYAYIAGDGGSVISARANCNEAVLVAQPTAQKPLLLKATYDSTHVFATEGANMYDLSVTTATAPCPPPNPVQSLSTVSYGVSVTPNQLIVLGDGTKTYLTNSSNQVLVYGPATGTSTLNLAAGSTASTTGGATLDGKLLFVGTLGTNDVQKFDTASGVVIQIPVGLKDKAGVATTPDFVAVRPK